MVMAVVSLAAAAESAVEARAEAEEAVMTAAEVEEMAEVEGTAVARRAPSKTTTAPNACCDGPSPAALRRSRRRLAAARWCARCRGTGPPATGRRVTSRGEPP